MNKIQGAGISAKRLLVQPKEVIKDLIGGLREGNNAFSEQEKQRRLVDDNASNPSALFIWIPKSAGTSMFAAFEQHGGQKLISVDDIQKYFKQRGVVTFGHLNVVRLVEDGLVTREFFEKAFKFTIVRNPFDRAVSLFEYLKRLGYLPKTTNFEIFCAFLEQKAFEKVELTNHDGLSQLNSQVTWLLDASGKLMADKVYRFENLSEEWPAIWQRVVGRKNAPNLSALNQSERRASAEYYTDKTIRIVRQVYAKDFELLDYSPEPSW
jgi:hypothetical protein